MGAANKSTKHVRLPGTRVNHDKDYEVKRDPDIRGVNKGRAEAEQYRDSRDPDMR